MKTLKILAVVVLLVTLLFGSGGKPIPVGIDNTADLQETFWVLTKISGKKVSFGSFPGNLPGQVNLILQKEGTTAYGSGGVNRFTGIYQLGENNSLTFGVLASTKMLGLDPKQNEIENDFFRALATTKRYKINGNTLRLLDEKNKVLAEFTALQS